MHSSLKQEYSFNFSNMKVLEIWQIVREKSGKSPGILSAKMCGSPVCSGVASVHTDRLVQERRNPSALAMELRLSCTNTSILLTLYFLLQYFRLTLQKYFPDARVYLCIYWSLTSIAETMKSQVFSNIYNISME